MSKKFKKLRDGQWSTDVKKTRQTGTFFHKIRCCDCALVHLVEHKISRDGTTLKFRAWRE